METGHAGQREFREQLGGLDADVGGGRRELALGAAHVRPPAQQIRRQTHGHFGRRRGDRRGGAEFIEQRARLLADEHAQPMHRLLERFFEHGDLRLRRRQQYFRFLGIQFAGQAGVETGAGDIDGILLGRDILVGDGQALLEIADIDVIARDLGENAHQHVAPIFLDGGEQGVGLLQGPSFPAEHVDLPARIEVRVIEVGLEQIIAGDGAAQRARGVERKRVPGLPRVGIARASH